MAISMGFVFGVLCLFAGCSFPTEKDFIPEKTGVSDDGLWLYLGAERMRSDGSEREALPVQKTLGGLDAEVAETLICAETHKLFYILEHETAQGLFCYDLVEGETEELIPYGENIRITESSNYLFAKAHLSRDDVGYERQFLFDRDGELLFEGAGYAFNTRGEVMYSSELDEEATFFRWWRGTLHSVTLPRMSFDSGDATRFIDGDYAYFLYENGILRTVDLNTGEQKEGTLPLLSNGASAQWENYSIRTVRGYPICISDDGEDYTLYTLKGGELVKVYSVARSNSSGIVFHGGAESGCLCFRVSRKGVWREYNEYVIFDRDFAFSVVGESKHSHSGEILPKFTCGEYAFWVEQKSWSPGLMQSSRYCLYLWRQKGSKTPEIMQYAFSGSDFLFYEEQPYYYFFEDILPV